MMDLSDWKDGHLVAHVHEKWGLAVTAQLHCLEFGANGIWASVCEEGAALGHACSKWPSWIWLGKYSESLKMKFSYLNPEPEDSTWKKIDLWAFVIQT